jgi:hypothetical protein
MQFRIIKYFCTFCKVCWSSNISWSANVIARRSTDQPKCCFIYRTRFIWWLVPTDLAAVLNHCPHMLLLAHLSVKWWKKILFDDAMTMFVVWFMFVVCFPLQFLIVWSSLQNITMMISTSGNLMPILSLWSRIHVETLSAEVPLSGSCHSLTSWSIEFKMWCHAVLFEFYSIFQMLF